MPLTVREVTDAAGWRAVRAIRQAVFVEEQACPPEEEWDAADAAARRGTSTHHLLGEAGGQPVACCRWRPLDDGAAKLERFAVVRDRRGQGLARVLVQAALDHARAAGHRRFVLHAQTRVAGLYRAFGFAAEGAPFEEAGIEHVKMTLTDP